MWEMRGALPLFTTLVCLLSFPAYGQDGGSLGDAARSARVQKEKDASGHESPAPKAVRVLTDDEAPQQTQDPAPASASSNQGRPASNATHASTSPKQSAEQWKSEILAQKDGISAMQSQIDKLNASIHFIAANCTGCAEWNERQLQKRKDVERARAQLEEQKKRLAEMQEAARQQGYGSSVYDP